jgi:hypothetical protein
LKPSKTSTGNLVAGAAAATAGLAGASYLNQSQSATQSQSYQQQTSQASGSSSYQLPGAFPSGSSSGFASGSYGQVNSSGAYPSASSSTPGKTGKQSNGSNVPLYAAGAAAAGLAAYGLSQHSNSEPAIGASGMYNNSGTLPPRSPQPYASGSGGFQSGRLDTMEQYPAPHEHKGPITRLKDGLLNLIQTP